MTQTVLSLLIGVQLKQFKGTITSDIFIHSLTFIECLPHVRHCARGRGNEVNQSLCPAASSQSRGRCAQNATGTMTELCTSVGSWKLFSEVR